MNKTEKTLALLVATSLWEEIDKKQKSRKKIRQVCEGLCKELKWDDMEESNKDCPNLDGIKVRAPKEICGALKQGYFERGV